MFPYCSPLSAAPETKSKAAAIQDEDANYLWLAEKPWGGLCVSTESASRRADDILPLLRRAWSDFTAGWLRHKEDGPLPVQPASRLQELLNVLALEGRPIWLRRRCAIRALQAQGPLDEALVCAEVSRGLKIPDSAVDAEWDRSRQTKPHRPGESKRCQ